MRKELSTISLSIILLALITLSITLPSYASPELILTIQTDKTKYNVGETLAFNGTLIKDGSPVTDALVAIQMVHTSGDSLIYRTLNTGTEPQLSWVIEILNIYPSDEIGNPKTSFRRGQTANFKVTVRNNALVSKHVVLTLNAYYMLSYETTFKAIFYFDGIIPPGTISFIPGIVIPNDAPICTVKVYANAYTTFPEDVGYAYCPEESATFTITSSSSSAATYSHTSEYTVQSLLGTYMLIFNLPSTNMILGNYTVYASTVYRTQQAFAYTTFEAVLLGDVNGDKIVDIFDAVLLSKASGSRPGDPSWDPRCDFNDDTIVDVFDAVILSANAGKSAA